MSNPTYYANSLIDKLKIKSVSDLQLLELMARERGVLIQDKPLKGAEARIAIVRRKGIITVSTLITDPRRKRFSIAHELGHFEMHRVHGNLALCTSADLDDWSARRAGTQREQEANQFAASLLLPERFFATRCRQQEPSLDLVADLSEEFNVSLTATAIRFIEFTDEQCAVVFSKDGFIKWFHASKKFKQLGVFLDVRNEPDSATLAAALWARRSDSRRPKRVKASAWFSSRDLGKDATIVEQSWIFSEYSSMLTLLWVDDDIEDFDTDDD